MFSFDPLPVVDTLNSHGGFWFLFVLMLIINIVSFGIAWDYDNWKQFIICFVGSLLLLNYTGWQSWTTGEIKVSKNEKVVGIYRGVQAEGEAYREKSGKQYITRENHYLYVLYYVEGYGTVAFKAKSGISYPERAILYKN